MSKFQESISIIPLRGLALHKMTELHPVQSDADYASMKNSIEEIGQTVPVFTYRGKVVDGRHRVKALRELGTDTIKAIALNPKQTLSSVRMRVVASDLRRNKTGPQKAIQAYFEMLDNPELSNADAALMFGTNGSEVSVVKGIAGQAGADILRTMLAAGRVVIGDKTYTNLRKLRHATKHVEVVANTYSEYTAEVKTIISDIDELTLLEDVSVVLAHCKKTITKMMEA